MSTNNFGGIVAEWRELEASGIPLEPLAFRVGGNSNGGVTIQLRPHPYDDGLILDRRSGRIAYSLPVFIQRDSPGKTIIRGVTLNVPWDDSIEWLEEDTRRNPGWYTFSEDHCPPKHEYAREIVLNHRMICTLSRGDFREGLLLTVGRVPPPENYRNGDRIPVTLSILDQWGCDTSAILQLRLERRRAIDEKIDRSTFRSLFSVRDKIDPRRSNVLPPLKKPSRKDEEGFRRTLERFALRHYQRYQQSNKRSNRSRGRRRSLQHEYTTQRRRPTR